MEPVSAGIYQNGPCGLENNLDFDNHFEKYEPLTAGLQKSEYFAGDQDLRQSQKSMAYSTNHRLKVNKSQTKVRDLAQIATRHASEQDLLTQNEDFMTNFKNFDTIVDTFCIFGPDQLETLKMANDLLDKPSLKLLNYSQEKILHQYNLEKRGLQMTPKLMSAYPETNRGWLVINDGTYKEMMNHAFGLDGYLFEEHKSKPELKRMQSYQFGALRRLYIEQLIFYEDLAEYQIAHLKHQLLANRNKQEKFEQQQKQRKFQYEEWKEKDAKCEKDLDDSKKALSRLSTECDSAANDLAIIKGRQKENKKDFFQLESLKRKRANSADSSRLQCNLFQTLIEFEDTSDTDVSLNKDDEKDYNLSPENVLKKTQYCPLNVIAEEQHSNEETSSKKSSGTQANLAQSGMKCSHTSPAFINSTVEQTSSQHRETVYQEVTEQIVSQKDLDKTLNQSQTQLRTNTVPVFHENAAILGRDTLSQHKFDENIFGQSLLRQPDSIFQIKKQRQTDKQFNKMSYLENRLKRDLREYKTQELKLTSFRETIKHNLDDLKKKLEKVDEKLKKIYLERKSLDDELIKSEKQSKERKNNGLTIWVPKSIAIISRYPFYDYFNRILETILDKMYDPQGLDRQMLEHFLFTIVWKIPCPMADNNDVIFDGIRISLPAVHELPYVNDSHFDLLLQKMEPEHIVRVFTALLFEERVLLIMEDEKELLPVSNALQSLIYPFELTIFIPYLANDGEEDDVNSIQQVSQPFGYFIGMKKSEKEKVKEILKGDIEYDGNQSPLIVDLSEKKKDQIFEYIKAPVTMLNKGQSKDIPSSYPKDSLPKDEEEQLIKKIKKALKDYGKLKPQGNTRKNYYYDQDEQTKDGNAQACHAKKCKKYPEAMSIIVEKDPQANNFKRFYAHAAIQDVRMAFFSTIAGLFLNYQQSIKDDHDTQTKEFDLLIFKSLSETPSNSKFYKRFFGDSKMVQNQIFSNYLTEVIYNTNDENAVLRVQRLDAEIQKINGIKMKQEGTKRKEKGIIDEILTPFPSEKSKENKNFCEYADIPDQAYENDTSYAENEGNEKHKKKVVQNCSAWLDAPFIEECFLKISLDRKEETSESNQEKNIKKQLYPLDLVHQEVPQVNPQDEIEENKGLQIKRENDKNHYRVRYTLFPPINKRVMAELQCQAMIKKKEDPKEYEKLFQIREALGQDTAMMNRKNTYIQKKTTTEVMQVTQIQICWVLMWCSMLSHQEKREVWFRLCQLIQVLQQLHLENNICPDLFFLLINTTSKHVDFRITKKLYETMARFQIPADNRIKLRYFNHFKDDLKKQKEEGNAAKIAGGKKSYQKGPSTTEAINDKEYLINRKEQQILITNSKLCKRVSYQYHFKKRTFKTTQNNQKVHVEEVKLKLQEQCNKCNGQLLAPQLKKAIETAYRDFKPYKNRLDETKKVEPKCTFCGQVIEDPVMLKYIIGKKVYRKREETVDFGQTSFWSAENLLETIEQYHESAKEVPGGWQIKFSHLRKKEEYKSLFWNLIYYFNEHQMPFDCILPYEKDFFEEEYKIYKQIQSKSVTIQKQPSDQQKFMKSSIISTQNLQKSEGTDGIQQMLSVNKTKP